MVDDGSTDRTNEVLAQYTAKDTRLRYYHRSTDRLKGANACRNIGLEKAEGEYVIFFDSDDLMTIDHIKVKLDPLLNRQFHFSIARTEWIKIEKKSLARYYNFDKYELNVHNYIAQNINWLTLDVCIEAKIAKSISFNEKLQSGQEFNYFTKLILLTSNGYIIDQVVSLRRMHKESVQSKIRSSGEKRNGSFISKWQTYLEISKQLKKNTKKVLLGKIVKTMFINGNIMIAEKTFFIKELYKVFGIKANLFFPMLFMKKFFNRGYIIRDYFNSGQ